MPLHAVDEFRLADPHPQNPHRIEDVLEQLRPEFDKFEIERITRRIVYLRRDADAARIGEAFEPRGNVDRVAEQVGAVRMHKTAMNAECGNFSRGPCCRGKAVLDIDGRRPRHRPHSRIRQGRCLRLSRKSARPFTIAASMTARLAESACKAKISSRLIALL